MERRAFLTVLGAGLLAAPLAAEAQTSGRVIKLGILSTVNPRTTTFTEAMVKRLGELGHVEGQNLGIEFRNAQGDVTRLPALAAELVHLNLGFGTGGDAAGGAEGDRHGPDCDRRTGFRHAC